MDDTSPQAQERYYELLRQRAPLDRLKIAVALTSSVRELAMAGCGERHRNRYEQEAGAHRLRGASLPAHPLLNARGTHHVTSIVLCRDIPPVNLVLATLNVNLVAEETEFEPRPGPALKGVTPSL